MSSKIFVAAALSLSLMGVAQEGNSISAVNGNLLSPESLYVVPATKVAEEGSVELTEDPSVLQVNIPVTYFVSSCMIFKKHNAVAFVEPGLPESVNTEQRAYEVRSYFSRKKEARMASAMPFSLPKANCEKQVEVVQSVAVQLKTDLNSPILATAISIPMQDEVARYIVMVNPKTGKVRMRRANKLRMSQYYKELSSL